MTTTPTATVCAPRLTVDELHRQLDVAWARITELGELLRAHNIEAGTLTPHLDHLAGLSARASADARTGETVRAAMRTITADASRDVAAGGDPATILTLTLTRLSGLDEQAGLQLRRNSRAATADTQRRRAQIAQLLSGNPISG